MTIIRTPRREPDFTLIANTVGLDTRLSMKALGLLVRLLCRPDNWNTNSETLAAEFNCGRDAVRAALSELSEAGYARLVKTQDAGGLWRSAWHIFDQPGSGFPAPVKPTPAKPGVGSSGAPLSLSLKNQNTNTKELNGTQEKDGGCKGEAPAKSDRRTRLTTLAEWRAAIKARGESAIPADDTINTYADSVGLLPEMIDVQWHHFCTTYTQDRKTKRYIDWRATFRNSVRQNWFGLWRIEEASRDIKWTSVGLQARAAFMAERTEQQEAHA